LNIPGDPLSPGCNYSKAFKALKDAGKAPPITYARIATEEGHTGLVVQYWFFYYFNQFNDLHEGDWEGMQIAFDGSTPREALATGPSEIALFQHEGGEKGSWDDPKVQKEGTHPVVYPAAGSHATFYSSAVFVENAQGGSGLGCDNTTSPVRRVEPKPVLIPTNPRVNGPFKWLTFEGRWGQKEKGYANGPHGPMDKLQWDEPFGMVFVEAMAMKRPVVAWAVGGALEIVVDGETGYLPECCGNSSKKKRRAVPSAPTASRWKS
jgi:hypothetical protein